MQQNDIILINLLDMLGHPLPGLIQALSLIHHSRFKIAALVVFLIQLVDILFGEGLIVETDGVVVGLAFSDDLVKDIAFLCVNWEIRTIFLLGLEILFELLQENIAFLLQFLLLFLDLIRFDGLQIDETEFGILLELDGKFAVDLGDVDDFVGLLSGV